MAYETILVGINFDPLSNVALKAAAQLAERALAKRIHIVHVAEIPPAWAVTPIGVSTGPFELAWDAARKMSNQKLLAIDRAESTASYTHETRLGAPAYELARAALEVKADLIVVGTSGHTAWHRFCLGSTASHVVQEAPCPVLVIPSIHEPKSNHTEPSKAR